MVDGQEVNQSARPAGRIWLDVPYGGKDEAKALGAMWDPNARSWYQPQRDAPGLDRWARLPDIPAVLAGEDRTFGSGLFVDLVPSTCWFSNVRSCVVQRDWERLRRMVLARAGLVCEACGRCENSQTRRWLEVHERWDYTTDGHTYHQQLRRLICLCTDCHQTTHFGYATVKGCDREALDHLCAVTGMTHQQALEHVEAAYTTWEMHSAFDWTLDLTILTNAGLTLTNPPAAADRPHLASQQLRVLGG